MKILIENLLKVKIAKLPSNFTTLDFQIDTKLFLISGLLDDYGGDIIVKVPKVPDNFEDIQNQHLQKDHLPLILPDDLVKEEITTTKKPSVSLQVLANFTQYCPPARSRNLFWNWTLAVSLLIFNLCRKKS